MLDILYCCERRTSDVLVLARDYKKNINQYQSTDYKYTENFIITFCFPVDIIIGKFYLYYTYKEESKTVKFSLIV